MGRCQQAVFRSVSKYVTSTSAAIQTESCCTSGGRQTGTTVFGHGQVRNACGLDVLRFATVGPSRILWSNSAESHETAGSWSRLGGKCLRDAFGNGLQDLTSNGHSIYIHLLQYAQQKNGADWKKTRELPWFILSSFHLKGTARSY